MNSHWGGVRKKRGYMLVVSPQTQGGYQVGVSRPASTRSGHNVIKKIVAAPEKSAWDTDLGIPNMHSHSNLGI